MASSTSTSSSASPSLPRVPDLGLAQWRFVARAAGAPPALRTRARDSLLAAVRKDQMAPFYRALCADTATGLALDDTLLKELTAANAARVAELDAKIADATENLGETEISDALIAKADYLARIGEKDLALTAYKTASEKTGPLGTRIDIIFAMIRIGMFFSDNELISRNIEKARTLIEEGGDWDRRNRLKVYEGIHRMSVRDFRGAVDNLLATLATFTSTELMDYKDFVKYAILTAAITLKRPDFKKKVIDAPEILEVINDLPVLGDYSTSLYRCDYEKFFSSLAQVEQEIKWDRLLQAHYRFYVREMRIIVYSQLLESYRSLTIESMAAAFGVTEDFLDGDLSKLIAAGRLNAVIDKVGGVVETNRPDRKNAQYQSTIKQGDLLLTRIQKLSRVVSMLFFP